MMPFQKNIKYKISWIFCLCFLLLGTQKTNAQEDNFEEEDTSEMFDENNIIESPTIEEDGYYDEEYKETETYIIDDTSAINYKDKKTDLLKKYRNDDSFVYTYNYGKSTSFWDKLAQWFRKILGLDWEPKQTQTVGEFFKWIIILVAVACLVFILFKNEIQGLFFNAKNLDQTLSGDWLEANIKSDEIDEWIAKAKSENNYDDLVRWYFVKTIQVFNEKKLISFHRNKTNNDYYYELKNKELKASFKELNYYFEHVVYGGFHITKKQMETAEETFQNIKSKL